MCNAYCILFGAINLKFEEIKGKKVIELDSHDVNGSLRSLIEFYQPKEYIGVDIKEGPGVDLICKAEDIVEKLGQESFDVILSTEMLEHVRDWRRVVHNIKNICKTDGIILITTRSYGCPYHDHPYDFWRYELDDMKYIFSDCVIEKLQSDPAKGIFIKVKKALNFIEKDLSDYELYSILYNKRVREISEQDIQKLSMRLALREKLRGFLFSIRNLLLKK